MPIRKTDIARRLALETLQDRRLFCVDTGVACGPDAVNDSVPAIESVSDGKHGDAPLFPENLFEDPWLGSDRVSGDDFPSLPVCPEPADPGLGTDPTPKGLADGRTTEEDRCVTVAGGGLIDLCQLSDRVFTGCADIQLDDMDDVYDSFASHLDWSLNETSPDMGSIQP
jgi:hypothetical protein